MNKLKQIIDMLQDEKIIEEIIGFIQWAVDRGSITEKQREKSDLWIIWLEKRAEQKTVSKTEPIIEGLTTEFQKQVSHLIASAINKEHKYNEDFVKWAANALLNYAKQELEKQGEQKPIISDDAIREGVAHFGITQYQITNWLKKYIDVVKQKPTEWSDKDWYYYNKLESFLEVESHYSEPESLSGYQKDVRETLIWLKSLKNRVQLQPKQEWSEEGKRNLLDVKCIIDEVWHNQDARKEIDRSCEELELLWHWLDNVWQKVEYPQNTWKPSDEQMEALWNAIPHIPNSEKDIDTITELSVLYEDLKKIKEG